ncbi:response regulator transcription factor [Rummeliibacillus sp. POC4]|uniref:response regulator transcription factor n=1 Tax=Rummeliibacillus sp. POC4 TaxID=2305899 RepID=UPI000E6754E6|nr:response regulator transcription factor [Rummeliibacillus sp. POC4]RIJ63421.1 DNA-binding response regulator [Rummeliibacillus sp. POC4]
MKILVAEDDLRLLKNIAFMLKKDLYQVDTAKNGEEALDLALDKNYDLVILDWMMPEKDGIEVCSELRENGYGGGILMLTARDDSRDVILGLDNGADDYLIKPFKMEVLLARVRAILRRKNKPLEQVIEIQSYALHLDARTLYRDNQEIELTKNEFLFLEYLFINKGRTLTREQIYNHIWGYNEDVSNNALDALVKLVRKKIDDSDHPSIIQTVRGIGYKLRDSHVQ